MTNKIINKQAMNMKTKPILMNPLKQFVCDTCGQIIESPEEGWVEWVCEIDGRNARAFRICHHVAISPRCSPEGCYLHGREAGRSDMHLDSFLENPMIELLRLLDVGPHHDPDFTGPRVANVREWTEFARRLSLPYYEQARLYWAIARVDGYFAGANEKYIYDSGFLKGLIGRYGRGRE